MTRRIPFSVVAKPTGAACNLDCSYCFFLSKELLYDQQRQMMTPPAQEAYVRAFLEAQPDGEVTLIWQGGEPTLRGLEFYRRAVELGRQYSRPGQRVTHAMQTNGTLLDAEWCQFFAAEGFLVGLSVDGPAALHDAHRVNRAGRGSHAQVERAWWLLSEAGVETNILCTVNAANQGHPLEVYRYFRDDLGARYLQFIPIVERAPAAELERAEAGWGVNRPRALLYRQAGDAVTSRSVDPDAWGRFMIAIFDEWLAHDVGTVFVQHVDTALAALFGQYTLCVHAPQCGNQLALEFNGDVYSCDHYVEPGYLLGNVVAGDRFDALLASDQQVAFGRDKLTSLPAQCLGCPVRGYCHGGCPKDRFATTRDGQPGLNHLCAGYYAFFSHMDPHLRRMAAGLRQGRPPAARA
ncbi:MAG: anaerobic sulfatase maturase [Propionibacteriaceae bacterium]|nr:anaerobic sulfatase maturase [Propionibacteriaceae bacterium]